MGRCFTWNSHVLEQGPAAPGFPGPWLLLEAAGGACCGPSPDAPFDRGWNVDDA